MNDVVQYSEIVKEYQGAIEAKNEAFKLMKEACDQLLQEKGQWQKAIESWRKEVEINEENIRILKKHREKLYAALSYNKAEWEIINPEGFKHLQAWQIARDILKETACLT